MEIQACKVDLHTYRGMHAIKLEKDFIQATRQHILN